MKPIVLVHGAWHAGWVWDKVSPLLESRGFKVIAPSLPGHDLAAWDADKQTLGSYVEAICDCVRAEDEPVLLVGHSMAGMVISQVAEYVPDRVRHLVYLSGILPKNGQSLMDLFAPQVQASPDPPMFEMTEDGTASVVKNDLARGVFYADCDESVAEQSISRLNAQAMQPFLAVATLSDEKFGSVPKTYIQLRQDRALYPESQKRMIDDNLHGLQVLELDSSHSPFLSQPHALADMLSNI